jgi:hypothetical protein
MTMSLTWFDVDDVAHPLTAANGVTVQRGVSGLDGPPRQNSVVVAGGSDGGVLLHARRGVRQIVLPLMFADVATTRTMISALQGPGRLVATTDGVARRLRDIVYEAGLEGEWSATAGGIEGAPWRKVAVALLALDPFWYGDEQEIVLSSPAVPAAWNGAIAWSSPYPWNGPGVGISAGVVWNSAQPWNAALPWNGGQVVSPNVLGDVASWPRFEFTGPASSFELIHLRTGERVASATSLSAGQTLVVETQPGAARGITLAGASVWDRVTLDSTAEMQLEPGDSLGVVMGGTGVDSTFRVTWTDRWLTPYGEELQSANAILTEDIAVMFAEDGSTLEGEP